MWDRGLVNITSLEGGRAVLPQYRVRADWLLSKEYTTQVTFCTIVRPDDPYINKTLPENLKDNWKDRLTTELVLLVPEGWVMQEEIRETLSGQSDSFLRVAEYPVAIEEKRLRNACFQLAEGLVLVNLESFDFTGPRGANYIFHEMCDHGNDLTLSFGKPKMVTNKFSVWRDTFYELGGFNEELVLSKQVDDFISRSENYGVLHKHQPHENFNQSLVKARRKPLFRTKPGIVKTEMTPLKETKIKWRD